MISSSHPRVQNPAPLGISAVTTFCPTWQLSNEWFEAIPRKFVKHTGIQTRPVSVEDEVSLATHATERLVNETGCDLRNCAAVVFTSPSFVPMQVARKYMDGQQARKEQLNRAAMRFVEQMGMKPRRVSATNSFCAGYARAMSIVIHKVNPVIGLRDDEFVLVLTAGQISRITDYSCRNTGALFGDMATATLISRADSETYPIHFELLNAKVERKPTNRPFFRFSLRQQVLTPTADGGRRYDPERCVFSLDGMGIADLAPRAMAIAASEMAQLTEWKPNEIQYIIPHQAGSAIVRLAEMKLRDAGFDGNIINGMTSDVGNVSSSSIPFTLHKLWRQLDGNILCPVASVAPPEKNAIAQGCIALRSTPIHHRMVAATLNSAATC